MEPTTLHELVIAQAVDTILVEHPTDQGSIIRDVAVRLSFGMTVAECQFLVRYVEWQLKSWSGEG